MRSILMKRAVDLVIAASALAILSPLLAVLALAIWVAMGLPVVFRQPRAGRGGKPFVMLKLRTMTSKRDSEGRLLPDDQRLTRLGRFLRSTSLDELPELVNVLRGEMSVVGPRPLLVEYLPRYRPEHARRHEVLPGITGWAQVNGRQSIPFSKRLALDVWYVDHWSIALDLRIIWLTLLKVMRRSDVVNGQDVGDVDDLGLSSGLVATTTAGGEDTP